MNKTIKIDFQVLETHDPKFLLVGDTSVWEYAIKKPAYILITLPGSSKPYQFAFDKNSINIFNSHNLGLSCFIDDCQDENYVDLPDGVYTICVKSFYEGIEKMKYYLKTDRFEVELKKTIIKNGLEYDEEDREFRDIIYQVKWLLDTAKSWASEGDFVKSSRFFNKAKKMLTQYRDCQDC